MADDKPGFIGEDDNAGYATRKQDLIAAAVLVLLSIWIMVESVRLPAPGGWSTAPGLLPFLTAATLCLMALALGWFAVRQGQAAGPLQDDQEAADHKRSFMLIGLIGSYLLCLQMLSFEYAVQLGGTRLIYGSFEVITTVAITAVLAVFWKQALWACLVVAGVWTTVLAAIFRYVFVIPLPG